MRWWDLARGQDGVVTSRQLRTCGQAARTISRRAARGELSVLSRGVYLVGGAPLTWRARLWAAVLATGGVLGYGTAGRLWGVTEDDAPEVHVIVPRDRRVSPPTGVRLHRRDVGPADRRVRSGLEVTSRPVTVLDLLGTMGDRDASRLADRAVQRGWIRRGDCERRLREHPGRHGNAQLRRLAAQLGDGAAATSERRLHRVLRTAGVTGWVPNHEVWFGGELVAVVDVALPALGIAVEVDGMAYHVDVDRFRRDRTRQNALVGLGWTVLRFTWADLVERPGYVVATIRQAIAGRAVG